MLGRIKTVLRQQPLQSAAFARTVSGARQEGIEQGLDHPAQLRTRASGHSHSIEFSPASRGQRSAIGAQQGRHRERIVVGRH